MFSKPTADAGAYNPIGKEQHMPGGDMYTQH